MVVAVLMAGIICVALVQTRSAYTAGVGSLLDASDLRSPQQGGSHTKASVVMTFVAPAASHVQSSVTCGSE
jgi:hypothetical protein